MIASTAAWFSSKTATHVTQEANFNYKHEIDLTKLSTEELVALKSLIGKANNDEEPRLIQDAEIIGDSDGTSGSETD